MEKVFLLEDLDCAHCAMKIEKHVSKIKGVNDANVDFVNKKLFVDYTSNDIDEEIMKTIHAIEPNVNVSEYKKNKKHHHAHTHVHGECCEHDHHHEHHHEEGDCCCGHDHHEHHHEEGDCCCGHNHHHEHHHEEGDCCCGHDHHHEHHHEEGECCCGHDHHHEHHHEEGECCCGHHHHDVKPERVIANADKLYIYGLDCPNCAAKVEDHVAHMDNVNDASLNFSNGILFVQVRDVNRKEETLKAIEEVVPTLESGVTIEREKIKQVEESKYAIFAFSKNWKLYLGILLFIIGAIFEDTSYGVYIFFVAFLFAGGNVVYTAFRNVIKGEVFDENFLMSVATVGAFIIRDYEEAVAVMIFYQIGELFQSYAVNHSRKSISTLMNIRADYATVIIDGEEVRKDPEDVEINDVIVVRPGERVPLDGVVLEGTSSLDTSALTGESMPRDVSQHDEVLAGVVNLNGVLTIKVMKEYGESTVSRILELVENASSKKAPMEKFITKFAKVYTPTVVGLALALAILPPIFIDGIAFSDVIESALTFLVVSCPCALVVSIPLGLFAGIGAASKRGILIKGGNYLEALKDVDTVVFDKTGTLTKGVFNVVDVYAENDNTDEVLETAAYCEYYSSHPIALSIKKAYGESIDQHKLANYQELAGHGINVTYDGKQVLLGNEELMKEHEIAYKHADALGTIVHIAVNQKYLGYLLIDDELKETSKQAISTLKQIGINKTCMLSGDRQAVGDHVAKELGLDEIHMELLPADKVAKVESLLAQETNDHKLVFVGDGINDAPVLARADVGVAMGGIGSDAAIEAADIVLMKDDPYALCHAIKIAHKTMRILWQNIIFSLGIKIGVLILAALGLANMWMGVFADVGVTLLAVLNSMRVLRYK